MPKDIVININMYAEFEWIVPFGLFAKKYGHDVTFFLKQGEIGGYLSHEQVVHIKNISEEHGIDVIDRPLFGIFFESIFDKYQKLCVKLERVIFHEKPVLLNLLGNIIRSLSEDDFDQGQNFFFTDARVTIGFFYFSKNRKVVFFPHVPGIMMSFSYRHDLFLQCDAALEGPRIADYNLRYHPSKTFYVGLPGVQSFKSRFGSFDWRSKKILFVLQKRFEPSGFTESTFRKFLSEIENDFNSQSFELYLKFHPKSSEKVKKIYFDIFRNFSVKGVIDGLGDTDLSFRCVLGMFSTAGLYYIPQGIPFFHLNARSADISLTPNLDRAYFYDHDLNTWSTYYTSIGIYEWADEPSSLCEKICSGSTLKKLSRDQQSSFASHWPEKAEFRILGVLDKISGASS